MVGITNNRWLATGLSTLMAAGLVVGTSAAAFAQDEECPAAEVTGELPDLTEELGYTPKVGLVMKSLANEFFQQMDAGAKAFADENTDLFEFQTVGMKDERDFNAQVEAVENYITQQFDVIVIAPASGSMTDIAAVSSSTGDPDSSNNSSSVTTTITGQADLDIVKTGPATALAGALLRVRLPAFLSLPNDHAYRRKSEPREFAVS